MAISPIVLNGAISTVQDASVVKVHEDHKPMIDQQNAQNQFDKAINDKREQVVEKDDARYGNRKFDAREKGDNEYYRDNKKKGNKKNEKRDGKVTVKGSESSFDVSI